MDEERFIDWYAVVDAVANGRLTGHVCPICAHGPLETSTDGVQVRVRCSNCGEGFEGALGQGRDDALYAEADALQKRQAAARRAAASKSKSAEDHHNSPDSPAASAPVPTATSTPAVRASSPERTRHEPWAWSLPNAGGDDLDALGAWMDVLTAVHNGRRSGLRCPFCSEPLTDVVVQDPHIRLRCTVCGETFEGQVR